MIWLMRSTMCDLLPGSEALPGLVDTDIRGFLALVQKESPPVIWLGLVSGAVVYALTPLLTVGIPLPSFWLPASARARHAERIPRTRFYLLRQSIVLLKMYATMCWGQDPVVRSRLALAAYPPDPGSFRLA